MLKACDIQRLLDLPTGFLLRVRLVLCKELRVQLDISGLVHAVHVSESRRDTGVGTDLAERLVDLVDVFGLRIQAVVVHAGVVNAVFLTTSDTDLHLEPKADGSHALEVLHAGRDVLLLRFLGEIKHVGGEERLLVLLEVLFVGSEHSIEPRKELLGTVIRVKNDRAVEKGSADMMSSKNPRRRTREKLTRRTPWRRYECGGQRRRHR